MVALIRRAPFRPVRQAAPSRLGQLDPWEFLIGLEGRASHRVGEASSRTAPRLRVRKGIRTALGTAVGGGGWRRAKTVDALMRLQMPSGVDIEIKL